MSTKEKHKWIYRPLKSGYYDESTEIVALDYYKKNDRGEDDFSRKQVWFYVYGDEEIQDEFREEMTEMLSETILPEEDWDYVTVLPTHIEGRINTHMEDLVENVSGELGLRYERVLRRNRTVEESHDIDSLRKKRVNLEDSLDVQEDVEDKNIILVDNISISGFTLLHAANEILKAGAKKVTCVCLGVSISYSENDLEISSKGLSEARSKIKEPEKIESMRK